MTDKLISVLCVDDNRDLADMLRAFIDGEPDMRCAGLVDSADGLTELVANTKPDVLILDLSMPGRCPIETLRELSEQAPTCRVIVHSGYDDQSRVDEAVAAGAWGFVSKHGDPQTLFAAIRRVHAGEVVIATGLAHAS